MPLTFKREDFIDETAGNIGAAMDVIDDLVAILNAYMDDDDTAAGYGGGCYGKGAPTHVSKMLKRKHAGEYVQLDG